ncbi:MAG: hypothetical protein IKQ82_08505 [Lentisphaeria bacterium]|nr:hypothetical protein [Lentisphaeria bacterium]
MEPVVFEIFEHGNPVLLEPLTCKKPALELELAAGTLELTLKARWTTAVKAGCRLRIASDFWPSKALLEKAAAAIAEGQAFSVTDSDGVAAECNCAGCGNACKTASIPADEASFRIRYPWDLLKINEEYLAGYTENDIKGTVRERVTLDGVVILGEGSVLLPGVYIEGVAVIGKNCKIGPNCYLRGYNFISDKCHIGQAVEIKNSILMTHVAAGHLSYIGDSIVSQNVNFGAGTITSNFRHDGKNHRSMVQGSLIDTGRRKFGSIIGENVHTGIHTAIYPGRKLWADVQTRPGDVVQLDLMK